MKISLIMSTYKRPHLLKWGLYSLSKQVHEFDFELLLLNDDFVEDADTVALYHQYKDMLNIRYFHTGKSKGQDIRREQCFALNFGIKKSRGDVIILTCPEMYHLTTHNIQAIGAPFLRDNKKILTTPERPKDDLNKKFLDHLDGSGVPSSDLFNRAGALSNLYNFFMGFWKPTIMEMGGFDEDFTGWAYDDTDFVYRHLDDGHEYHEVNINLIHLWHKRGTAKGPGYKENIEHNRKLFEERRGIIKRNVAREWGVMSV